MEFRRVLLRAAEPDVEADTYRAPELQPGGARGRVARVVGGEDLHARRDLGAVADRHFAHVEDHAVEVEEHAVAQANIEAVVAVERRPHVDARTHRAEALAQQRVPRRLITSIVSLPTDVFDGIMFN